ncbi:MAG: molybdopterin-guanine dinucleotide biosynthesis protein MobB [Rhodospirillales bacterium]
MQVINLTGSLRRRDIGVALVTEARRRELSVAVLLRSEEEDFDPDVPGKDSYEHRKAGAREVLLASARARALMCETGEGLRCQDVATRLENPDILLVDGDCHPGGIDLLVDDDGQVRLGRPDRLLADPPGVIAALLIGELVS